MKKGNERDPFDFATLDDYDDTKGSKQSRPHQNHGPFGGAALSSLSGNGSGWKLFLPTLLVISWLIVFFIELGTVGTSYKGLAHWPVVMGDVNHISILQPMTTWVHHFSAQHGAVGIILFVLTKLASLLVMMVCLLVTGFLHFSGAHLFGNMVVFTIVSLGLWTIGIYGRQTVLLWLEFSVSGVGIVWFVTEFLGLIMGDLLHVQNVLVKFTDSQVPIIGASVGIFGLLGFLMFQILRQFRLTFYRGTLLIVMIGIAVALLYTNVNNIQAANGHTVIGATAIITGVMHLFGYGYGALRGLRFKLKD